jgi:hypothetical protein
LGRAVTDREIEVVVARTPGVASVSPVRLFTKTKPAEAWRELPRDAKDRAVLPLRAWQLPEMLSVVVAEGADAPDDLLRTSPAAPADLVVVPIVPELC